MHKKLLPAYLLVLVNILGFSLMLPVLPFIVEDYGAPKYVYGFLLSSYSLFQFLAAPYLGKLSDFKGRKPVLLISQAGTFLCWVVYVIAYFTPQISQVASRGVPLEPVLSSSGSTSDLFTTVYSYTFGSIGY